MRDDRMEWECNQLTFPKEHMPFAIPDNAQNEVKERQDKVAATGTSRITDQMD